MYVQEHLIIRRKKYFQICYVRSKHGRVLTYNMNTRRYFTSHRISFAQTVHTRFINWTKIKLIFFHSNNFVSMLGWVNTTLFDISSTPEDTSQHRRSRQKRRFSITLLSMRRLDMKLLEILMFKTNFRFR